MIFIAGTDDLDQWNDHHSHTVTKNSTGVQEHGGEGGHMNRYTHSHIPPDNNLWKLH